MPGSMPATSQLDWLSSITAMIVLFWSRATRDLLKSFGWGIAGTPSIRYSDEVAISRRPPHSIYRSRGDAPNASCAGSLARRLFRSAGIKPRRHSKIGRVTRDRWFESGFLISQFGGPRLAFLLVGLVALVAFLFALRLPNAGEGPPQRLARPRFGTPARLDSWAFI